MTAVLLAFHRPHAVAEVLERLRALPVAEVIVVDNSSDEETADVVRAAGGNVRLLKTGENLGIAGRNRAVEVATHELVVMLDDDSYPLPGAVEELAAMFEREPRLGVVGGLVRDVDAAKQVVLETELGTFDWWLRGGAEGPPPDEGFPAFFFPEGASMVRRRAYVEVGGFYEPFFFASTEVDLATRFLAAGWDVRYQPRAAFDHMKVPAGRASIDDVLRLRIRNHLWYLWLRFPLSVAVPRMVAYGAFDLLNAVYRGAARSWAGGVVDAWRLRDRVRADRAPIPRSLVARAEGRRLRMHLEVVTVRLREGKWRRAFTRLTNRRA